MSYQFSLESLLRVLSALERREESALARLAQEVAQARAAVAACDLARNATSGEINGEMTGGLRGAEIHFANSVLDSLQRQRTALESRVADLQKKHAAQLEKLLAVRRRREALDCLRQREMDDFAREALRREQRLLDEMFLIGRRERMS